MLLLQQRCQKNQHLHPYESSLWWFFLAEYQLDVASSAVATPSQEIALASTSYSSIAVCVVVWLLMLVHLLALLLLQIVVQPPTKEWSTAAPFLVVLARVLLNSQIQRCRE